MISYGLDTPLVLGVMEIGVFVSLVLFGVVALQGYVYYRHNCTGDRVWLKVFVGILLALELAHTLAACHVIYYFTVVQAGIPELTKKPNSYSLAMTPVFETVITAMVQGFFAYRIRLLSGRLIIPAICSVLLVARLAGGLAMAIESFRDIPLEPDYFHYQDTYGAVITSALNIGVVLDVLITLSLCFYFRQMYTPYNLPRSEELIARLIAWTIQTGLITSLTSIAVVITFQTMKHNFIWLALYTLLAKLYSNSLIVSLNSRPINRQIVRGQSPAPTTIKTWSRWDSTPMPTPPGSPRPSLTIQITRTRSTDTEFLGPSLPPSRPPSPPGLGSHSLLSVPEKAAYVRSMV